MVILKYDMFANDLIVQYWSMNWHWIVGFFLRPSEQGDRLLEILPSLMVKLHPIVYFDDIILVFYRFNSLLNRDKFHD